MRPRLAPGREASAAFESNDEDMLTRTVISAAAKFERVFDIVFSFRLRLY